MKNIQKKLYSFAIIISIFSATEGMEAEQIRTEVNRVLEQFHRNMEEYYERTRVKKGTIISVKQEAAQNGKEQPRKREIEWQEVPIKPQIEKLADDAGRAEPFTKRLQEENDAKPQGSNQELKVYNPEGVVKQEVSQNQERPYWNRALEWQEVPIESQIQKLTNDMRKTESFIRRLQKENNSKHPVWQFKVFNYKLEGYFGGVLAEMEEYYGFQVYSEYVVEKLQILVWNPMWAYRRLYATLMKKIEMRRSGIGKDPARAWPGPLLKNGQCSNQWVLESLMKMQDKQKEIYDGISKAYQPCYLGRLMYVRLK